MPATARSTRQIYAALISSGIVSVLAIAGILYWMAHVTNTLARDASVDRVNAALDGYLSEIADAAGFFAHWTVGFELLMAEQTPELVAEIDLALGTTVTVDQQFDQMYLTAPDGTPRFAYVPGSTSSDLTIFDPTIAKRAKAELDLQLPDPLATHASLTRIDGRLAAIAAARIQPVAGSTPDPSPLENRNFASADLPLMIFVEWVEPEVVGDLAGLSQVDQLRLLAPDEPISPSASYTAITDSAGTLLGHLSWMPPRPADLPLQQILPWVAAVSLALIAASVVIARATARQTQALTDARHSARTDHLTGLPNRTGLEELVASATVARAMAKGKLAALYLDLNGFKKLNDNEGHDAGDLALQITADRLRNAIRETDYVIRLGGDEFLCLVLDDRPRQAARYVANRILNFTDHPVQINQTTYAVRPSIGVAVSQAGMGFQDLLNNADTAMYAAKIQKSNCAVFHAPGMARPTRHAPEIRIIDMRAPTGTTMTPFAPARTG